MSDIAIKIEALGKRYRYGAAQSVSSNLRADLTDWVRGVFHRGDRRPEPEAGSLKPEAGSLPASGSHSEKSSGISLPASVSRLTFKQIHEEHLAHDPNYFWALKDINLEVRTGEVVGIIGRNGAGKSTLLKILSRITPPTTGKIAYNGRMASLLEVGTGFHRELTGRENIFLNGSILGMKRTEIAKKLDEIVAFAEVEKFIDTPVKFYSSGMYVRLAFAVAAHLEPEILVVDEVLAVGDAAFQKKCMGKMDAVSKEGRTVLFVSHNMQAVAGLCNHGVLIESGRIVEVGHPADVIDKYMKVSADLLSLAREQIWDMQTAPGNDRIRLHRISFLADTDDPIQEIHLDTPIRVEIEYWNLVSNTEIIIDFCFYSIDGTPVFEDWTLREPTWEGKPFPQGLFRTVCRIPGNLFNEGTFRMRILFIDKDATHLFNREEAVVFTVTDVTVRLLPWYGKFMGFVRPQLHFQTSLLESKEDVPK